MPQTFETPTLDDISTDFHNLSRSLDMLVDVAGNFHLDRPLSGSERAQIVGLAAVMRDFAESQSDKVGDLSRLHKIVWSGPS